MNNFLFIIPVTPKLLLNNERLILQNLCVKNLLNQTYSKWRVLWVSEYKPTVKDSRFIHVNYEGLKEDKLQIATQYISENNIHSDYIIRLDDDDLFNINILNELKNLSFNLYVDKYHTFWYYPSSYFSTKVCYWFPNTCIHKTEHALSVFGELADQKIKKINNDIRLIENDHSLIHNYYRGIKILHSKRRNPVYIRSITKSSITSKMSLNSDNYFSSFGIWNRKKYTHFIFQFNDLTSPSRLSFKQLFWKYYVYIVALKNYSKITRSN